MDLSVGHPDFGRPFPCQCSLAEGEMQRRERLQRYSNLGGLISLTFDTLIARGRSSDNSDQELFAEAVVAAKEFVGRPSGWLVIAGPSGCGKTHLASAIANSLIEQGHTVLFVVTPDFLDHLRAAYRPDSDVAYDELFEQVRNSSVVILDDLGHYSATAWAEEKLFQLINHRYNLRLPTIFTVGVLLENLDARLTTRLCDGGLARILKLQEAQDRSSGAFGGLSLAGVRSMTFETFEPGWMGMAERERHSLREAFEAARNYAQSLEGWLVLLGPTGSGKTHLAAAIGNYLSSKGVGMDFCVVPDLLEGLREAMRDEAPAGQFYERFEAVRTSPFLILDDLGVHSATSWAQEKLFQVLNYRYNARLPTVITVGCPIEELPPPWVSRMCDLKQSARLEIEATVPDYRLQSRHQVQTVPSRRRGRPRRAAS